MYAMFSFTYAFIGHDYTRILQITPIPLLRIVKILLENIFFWEYKRPGLKSIF
jgi:hypothetical protein